MRHIFQFHKGTIRTRIRGQIINIAKRFQFHKGTIRTIADQEPKKLLRNFNSIKVRLEHTGGNRVTFDSGFQFHKGTIRTLRT